MQRGLSARLTGSPHGEKTSTFLFPPKPFGRGRGALSTVRPRGSLRSEPGPLHKAAPARGPEASWCRLRLWEADRGSWNKEPRRARNTASPGERGRSPHFQENYTRLGGWEALKPESQVARGFIVASRILSEKSYRGRDHPPGRPTGEAELLSHVGGENPGTGITPLLVVQWRCVRWKTGPLQGRIHGQSPRGRGQHRPCPGCRPS